MPIAISVKIPLFRGFLFIVSDAVYWSKGTVLFVNCELPRISCLPAQNKPTQALRFLPHRGDSWKLCTVPYYFLSGRSPEETLLLRSWRIRTCWQMGEENAN